MLLSHQEVSQCGKLCVQKLDVERVQKKHEQFRWT